MKIKKIVAYYFFLLPFVASSSQVTPPKTRVDENYSLVVGKPYKVKFHKQLSDDEQIVLASKYVAYFKDYKVVHGNLKGGITLKVELQASSELAIKFFDEIYVIVKDSKSKILQGVDWGEPIYNVCLPKNDISKFAMKKEFSKIKPRDGVMCTSLYDYDNK